MNRNSNIGKGIKHLPKIVISPPSHSNSEQEVSECFKHAYSKIKTQEAIASTESPKVKASPLKTIVPMESISKKITDSQSSQGEDKEEIDEFQQTISSDFNSGPDYSSESESDEDQETLDEFMARMQEMREEIVRSSISQVPPKYQHLFTDDESAPIQPKENDQPSKMPKKEKKKRKFKH